MTTTATPTKPLSKAAEARIEKQRAIDFLRAHLPPGSTVYTTLKHVSRSGMMRRIAVTACIDGEYANISYYVARALGWTLDDGGIRVSGCGMDMGFHVVHCLGYALYPDGFRCIGERCPAADHSNPDSRHITEHGKSQGGYALRHRWL